MVLPKYEKGDRLLISMSDVSMPVIVNRVLPNPSPGAPRDESRRIYCYDGRVVAPTDNSFYVFDSEIVARLPTPAEDS